MEEKIVYLNGSFVPESEAKVSVSIMASMRGMAFTMLRERLPTSPSSSKSTRKDFSDLFTMRGLIAGCRWRRWKK